MVTLLGLVCAAASVGASNQPASKPTSTQGAPVAVDPTVEKILDRLEKRGDGVNSLTSKLQAEFFDVIAEDKQIKQGRIWFRRDQPNPKFKVIYDKSIYADYEVADVHEYLFDGRWLTEKHDKSKSLVHREIVAEGEKIDPFRIGKGPFPLPFGQKKADIIENFTVSLAPRSPKDPPGTDHLRLIPHKGSSMAERYVEIHFYVDQKIDLPVRVVAHQHRPGSSEVDEIVTVGFKDIDINPKVDDSTLMIIKPVDKDWHTTEEPLPTQPPSPERR